MDDNKHSISISSKLYNDIKNYCALNELKVNTFVEELLRKAFNVEKFGEAPFVKFREEESRQESRQSVQIETPKPPIHTKDEYVELLESRKSEPINELNDEPINEPEPKPKKEKKVTRLN